MATKTECVAPLVCQGTSAYWSLKFWIMRRKIYDFQISGLK